MGEKKKQNKRRHVHVMKQINAACTKMWQESGRCTVTRWNARGGG